MFRVDRLILTPPMIDLDRSPLAGQFDAETYVLGAFNPCSPVRGWWCRKVSALRWLMLTAIEATCAGCKSWAARRASRPSSGLCVQ